MFAFGVSCFLPSALVVVVFSFTGKRFYLNKHTKWKIVRADRKEQEDPEEGQPGKVEFQVEENASSVPYTQEAERKVTSGDQAPRIF